MRLWEAFPVALAALVTFGCEALGPRALRAGRNEYNRAIQQTDLEQLLLNIVRLRFVDHPYFLLVSSISAALKLPAAAGIPDERIALLGFSQGACLALEYVARHARRYGGVFGLSGGLIGPAGTPREYTGSLAGTPVFLGCSDNDPHIPSDRVIESAESFRRMGAEVTARLYPQMGHTVNQDELDFVRSVMDRIGTG